MTLTRLSHSLLKDSDKHISPIDAWNKGTNIQSALKVAPQAVRGWIVSEVGRLCKELDCKTTISSDSELKFCCRSIIEENPTLTLEEIRVCFDWIRKGKYGKLYERLKTPEILDCLSKYQGETRAEILEQKAREQKKEMVEKTEESLEPLGLVELYDSLKTKEPEQKKQGIGTRLREKNNWHNEE